VTFYEICRYTVYNCWPRDKGAVFKEEQIRCKRMREFVEVVGDDRFMFRYEDMVGKKFEALNAYLKIAAKHHAALCPIYSFFSSEDW
jgi:hypothetical protein